MLTLSMVYTIALIVAGIFAIWIHTKRGKKWLKDL